MLSLVKGRAWLPALALSLGALAPVVAAPEDACASGSPRATLVVDAGARGGVQTFCVTLPHEGVSGIELIELAGQQHGLAYRFGFGGQGVCMLAGVGPTGGDCFADFPDFWGYWRASGSGGWSWSGSGAGAASVGDGDVEGWSWSRGSDGSTHRAPPPTSFSAVCPDERPEPAPKPETAGPGAAEEGAPPAPSGGDASGSGASPADTDAGATAAQGPGAGRAPRASESSRHPKRPRPGRAERAGPRSRGRAEGTWPQARVAETIAAPDSVPARAAAPGDEGTGPPGAAIAGVGATLVMAGAGAVLVRRRRPGG